MKHKVAVVLLGLLSLWSGFLAFACWDDASRNIQSKMIYFSCAFLFAMTAGAGLVATMLVAKRRSASAQWLTIWIALSAASTGAFLGVLLSPQRGEVGAVFCAPQILLSILIVGLLTQEHWWGLSRIASSVLLAAVLAAVIVHLVVPPADQVVIRDWFNLEFYLPQQNQFYLRPFSMFLAAACWAGALMGPLASNANLQD